MFRGQSFNICRKAYLVSLRHKLLKSYRNELEASSVLDRRWVNGFMAAGFHSGLISLKELKLECLSSYRSVFHKRMTKLQEIHLERRLQKLCRDDPGGEHEI